MCDEWFKQDTIVPDFKYMTTTAASQVDSLPPPGRRRSLNGLALQLSAVALSFILVALLVVHTSQQAFNATTSNTLNSATTGQIALSDNDNNGYMFNVTGLVPGTTVYRCITVSYTGTLTSTPVALYSAGTPTGTLAPYLNLTVDVGPGTSDAFSSTTSSGCTNFSSSASLFTGTLNGFATSYPNYGQSVNSGWTPTNNTTRTFRFGISVQDNNNAMGQSTGFGLQWETRSS